MFHTLQQYQIIISKILNKTPEKQPEASLRFQQQNNLQKTANKIALMHLPVQQHNDTCFAGKLITINSSQVDS